MHYTIFLEVVYLEAHVPVSLLGHPAEVNKVFAGGQFDVGRRRCEHSDRGMNIYILHNPTLFLTGRTEELLVPPSSVVAPSLMMGSPSPAAVRPLRKKR